MVNTEHRSTSAHNADTKENNLDNYQIIGTWFTELEEDIKEKQQYLDNFRMRRQLLLDTVLRLQNEQKLKEAKDKVS